MLKDLKYELIMSDAVLNLVTEPINGYLEAIMLDSDKMINISIVLEDNPEIVIFENQHFIGKDFLVVRTLAQRDSNTIFNYSQERIPLNNNLVIILKGQPETNFKIMLRYADA